MYAARRQRRLIERNIINEAAATAATALELGIAAIGGTTRGIIRCRVNGKCREVRPMVDEKLQRALPRDVPNYHQRQAAHFRALAETADTPASKARLLREAEKHERAADES
jgi:hypothetical protein